MLALASALTQWWVQQDGGGKIATVMGPMGCSSHTGNPVKDWVESGRSSNSAWYIWDHLIFNWMIYQTLPSLDDQKQTMDDQSVLPKKIPWLESHETSHHSSHETSRNHHFQIYQKSTDQHVQCLKTSKKHDNHAITDMKHPMDILYWNQHTEIPSHATSIGTTVNISTAPRNGSPRVSAPDRGWTLQRGSPSVTPAIHTLHSDVYIYMYIYIYRD